MGRNRSKVMATAQLVEWGLRPRVLDTNLAAAYVGLSPRAFRQAVKDGIYPPSLGDSTRARWDVCALDAAVDRRSGLTPTEGEDEIMRAINAI